MKIFKWFLGLFKRKHYVSLSPVEYDELVDAKLDRIRDFVKSSIYVRDDDESFNKQFEEAFLLYERFIKTDVLKHASRRKSNDKEIVLSPVQSLNRLIGKRKYHNVSLYKRLTTKIRFKITLYYQHLLLMREIRKMKKLFPNRKLSNRHAVSIVNAVKLNKRVQELYPKAK
jgi:hypothetical protein